MFAPVYAAFASAALFYLLFPVLGAFLVRSSWRAFRRSVARANGLPPFETLCWKGLYQADARVEGEVEALGEDDELWIRGNGASAILRMAGATVYLMDDEGLIERVAWNNIRSLQPGLRVYACGSATAESGRITLYMSETGSLALLYGGPRQDVAMEAIRNGRHRNEYWNPLTQASLVVGLLASAGIASTSLAREAPALLSALILTAAGAPLLPLLPPGVAAFLGYRHYWRRARYYRSRRDLADFSAIEHRMARGWRIQANLATLASVTCFAAALAVNAWLAVYLLRMIL